MKNEFIPSHGDKHVSGQREGGARQVNFAQIDPPTKNARRAGAHARVFFHVPCRGSGDDVLRHRHHIAIAGLGYVGDIHHPALTNIGHIARIILDD